MNYFYFSYNYMQPLQQQKTENKPDSNKRKMNRASQINSLTPELRHLFLRSIQRNSKFLILKTLLTNFPMLKE